MLSPKSDEFLERILVHVKFPFAKNEIKTELESHLIDKMDYYSEQGYDEQTAEQLAISDMGDAGEIGVELNRVHNPISGWIWKITNLVVALFIIINVYIVGVPLAISLGQMFNNPAADIPKSDIVYNINVNKKVQLDDMVIEFTNVIFEKNGDMNIFYKYYDTNLWGAGWSLGTIGNITDNLGNKYFSGGGYESGGIVATGRRTVNNFSREAGTLIISYDEFNRKFKVEIPLKRLNK